jgi:hypothetical protein
MVAPRGATEFAAGDQILCVCVEDVYRELRDMARPPAVG